jgi:zinc/manganese transport system substrate-binding protein
MRWSVRISTWRSAAAAGLASTLLVAGCGSSGRNDSSSVEVVASTGVYGEIAATVGGDNVSVTSFISSPSQDPHSYEANARDVLTISHADVVIENGGGYDDFMDQLLHSAGGDPTVLNAVELSDHTAPGGGTLNEHVWYDVAAMQRLTGEIATALGAADPDHADLYRKNAERLAGDLATLVDREADLRTKFEGIGVGITEPVPGYLLDAVGLVNLTPDEFSEAIEEGMDVSVSVLNETLTLYTDHKVAALVYNEQTSGTTTDQVTQAAADAGVPVVPVTETLPDGDTYLTWMNANLDNLEKALSQT